RRVATIRAVQPLDDLVDVVTRCLGRRLRVEPMERGRETASGLVQGNTVGKSGQARAVDRESLEPPAVQLGVLSELSEVSVAAAGGGRRAMRLLAANLDVLGRERVVLSVLVMQKDNALRVAEFEHPGNVGRPIAQGALHHPR